MSVDKALFAPIKSRRAFEEISANIKSLIFKGVLKPGDKLPSEVELAKQYQVGQSQPSYDKQPLRDWLVEAGWDKEPPAPTLPPEIIEATSKRYREGYEKLTGKELT